MHFSLVDAIGPDVKEAHTNGPITVVVALRRWRRPVGGEPCRRSVCGLRRVQGSRRDEINPSVTSRRRRSSIERRRKGGLSA